MKTDRLASELLEFQNGAAIFTCSTQINDRKYVGITGTKGRIDIENKFDPGPN